MVAAGLPETSAYCQTPPAELVFLQPGLHREVHAGMCLCDLVIEEPSGDEREEKEGKRQETERGRRWKRPVQRVAPCADSNVHTLRPSNKLAQCCLQSVIKK